MGTKVWFGPRRFGWGLEPVSAEGWAATAAFAGIVTLAARRSLNGSVVWLLIAAYVALVVAKGTDPGGPRARQILAAKRVPD